MYMSQKISPVKIITGMEFLPVKSWNWALTDGWLVVILSAVVAKLGFVKKHVTDEFLENNKITSRLPNNLKETDLPMVVLALKILLDLKLIINLPYSNWMLVLPEITITQSIVVAMKYSCHKKFRQL